MEKRSSGVDVINGRVVPPHRHILPRASTPASGRSGRAPCNARTRSSNSRRSNKSPGGGLGLDEDDDVVRSRRFWEKWSTQVVEELLREFHLEQNKANQKEWIYSARLGREPRLQRSPSSESLDTEITLLTCSGLDAEAQFKVNGHRASSIPSKSKQRKSFLQFANKRYGNLLERLIKKDIGNLDRYIQGSYDHRLPGNFLSEEESDLVRRCGRSIGLVGHVKSLSTDNILTHVPKTQPRASKSLAGGTRRRSSVRAARSNATTQMDIHEDEDDTLDSAAVSRQSCRPTSSATMTCRGITPSPQLITLSTRKEMRSLSAAEPLCNSERVKSSTTSSRASRLSSRQGMSPFSIDDDFLLRKQSLRSSVPANLRHSFPRSRSVTDQGISHKIQARINDTLRALQRTTGTGDPTNKTYDVTRDKNIYTNADLARIPRYPQNIRISPQLSHVIYKEIRQSMGQPRVRALTSRDLITLDANNPMLGRTNRNLLIFNWLSSISEDEWVSRRAPSIYDLEGEAEIEHVYPRVFDEVVDGLSSRANTHASSRRSTDDDLDIELAELEKLEEMAGDDEDVFVRLLDKHALFHIGDDAGY